MGGWLRQSTAVTIVLGPFVDSVDGDTEETAISVLDTDVMLRKEGGTTIAAKADTTDATHRADGMFTVPLGTGDTDTLGNLRVYVHVAGAMYVWEDYLVLPGPVYDALVLGTDYLDANVVQWLGTACHAAGTAGVPIVEIHDQATVLIDAIWDEVVTSGHAVAGSGGKLMADYLNASISAVKTKTDSLTFTVAGKVDSNVYTWNGTAVHTPVVAGVPIIEIHDKATEYIAVADALLDRNMGTGTDSGGRTVRNALRPNVNKVAISGGTMTVYKEDDATSAWTAAITTDASAQPIVTIDPA